MKFLSSSRGYALRTSSSSAPGIIARADATCSIQNTVAGMENLSALPTDVLVEPRVDLWSRVLRRQPLPLSLLATHPIDVSRN